jgi:isoleucyl-tRNA synthetase
MTGSPLLVALASAQRAATEQMAVAGEAGLTAQSQRIRAEVLRELEAVRSAGGIGSSLQAELELHLTAADFELVDTLGDDLRFVMITSQARIVRVDDAGEAGVVVHPSRAMKCERCWHWRDDVGQDAAHPTICGRCVSNLHGAGEARTVA